MAVPQHQVPENFETAQQFTATVQVPTTEGTKSVVTLIYSAPGKTVSFLLMPDDAINWGEMLSQAGRNAKSGLIL